jgi:hypothetical protein
MMITKIKILFIVPPLILLSACNALKITEANQALSNHYYAKEKAQEKIISENENLSNIAILNSVNLALQDLAIETQKVADEESNVKNRIVLYRISATAAWQSDLLKASDYSAKGHSLCQTEKNIEDVHVHCGMLAFIPLFSAVDKNTVEAKRLKHEIENARVDDNMVALKRYQIEAQSIFDNYKTAITAALITKQSISNYQLSESFSAQVDDNMRDIVCNKLSQTNTLISRAKGNNVANESAIAEMKALIGQKIKGSC